MTADLVALSWSEAMKAPRLITTCIPASPIKRSLTYQDVLAVTEAAFTGFERNRYDNGTPLSKWGQPGLHDVQLHATLDSDRLTLLSSRHSQLHGIAHLSGSGAWHVDRSLSSAQYVTGYSSEANKAAIIFWGALKMYCDLLNHWKIPLHRFVIRSLHDNGDVKREQLFFTEHSVESLPEGTFAVVVPLLQAWDVGFDTKRFDVDHLWRVVYEGHI